MLWRYVLPLQPLSCPVDQAFLRSIAWPLHAAYREARRVGDGAVMLHIRLEVQRERAAWVPGVNEIGGRIASRDLLPVL